MTSSTDSLNSSRSLQTRTHTDSTRSRSIEPVPFSFSFSVHLLNLLESTLDKDIDRLKSLSVHPIFEERTCKNLNKDNWMSILISLSRNHLGSLSKKEVLQFIKAVGESSLVSSSLDKQIKALYKSLFSPHSSSKKEMEDDEGDFSLDTDSDVSVNGKNRKESSSIDLPPLSFSKEELLTFESQACLELRPHILLRILKHPSFKEASLEEVCSLVSKLQETERSNHFEEQLSSAFFKHPTVEKVTNMIEELQLAK